MPLIGFLFPDLGSQKQGMGKTLYDKSYQARKVYQQAEKATGLKVIKFCFVTPPDEMEDLAEASVAIMAHSLAAFEMLKANQRDPQALAGHGLGELAALTAGGAFEYSQAFQLAMMRGAIMDSHQEESPGVRIWLSGLPQEKSQEIITEAGKLGYIKVVSRLHPEACLLVCEEDVSRQVLELAKQAKAEKAEIVGRGLFGTERAAKASAEFLDRLGPIKIGNLKHTVISITSGRVYRTFADIRTGLAAALSQPTNLGGVVARMKAEGVSSFLSLGPGSLLAIAVRKIERGVQTAAVDDFSSLATAIKITR